jgi:hypothetical protein
LISIEKIVFGEEMILEIKATTLLPGIWLDVPKVKEVWE